MAKMEEKQVKSQDEKVETSIKNLVLEERTEPFQFITYHTEEQLPWIVSLIEKDLSEPYSVYTYRYFLNSWPHLCFLVSVFSLYSFELISNVWGRNERQYKIINVLG
eukprot:TRINITY_DN3150_c0_g1_i1.p1 TRINITY_DN3150_c0_g1~~TRINITY_DN3150_c0_g1_i1.p1  ORF type:complete len:107 (+),score=6.64 TRINITY_DN3150_c0_g1_i1:70-390(+)